MGETRVVNLREEPYDVYIGRPARGFLNKGYFGNPYKMRGKGQAERERAIREYRIYFRRRIAQDGEFRERIESLRGMRLGCFCKPLACHGDVIAEWLDAEAMGITKEAAG